MLTQTPYRWFPAISDLQRAGLLPFPQSQRPQSHGTKKVQINASADESSTPRWDPLDRSNFRRVGEINEVQFAVDGSRHGYIFAKPYTSEAFDLFAMPRNFVRRFVTDNQPSQDRMPSCTAAKGPGREARVAIAPIALVQVRSTNKSVTVWNGKTPYYVVSTKHGTGFYSAAEIDIFAAYVEPLRIWYIIPFGEIGRKESISLFPHDPKSKGKYEKFRERWDLLSI